METDRQQAYEGQAVRLQVTLNHVEKPSPPDMPSGKDFSLTLVGQQSLDSREVRIINGQMSEVVRRGRLYEYRLIGHKAGELTLPGPVAHADGRVIHGPQITLQVLPVPKQDVVVLRIAADRAAVYPSQPFRVTLSVLVKSLPGRHTSRDPVSVQPQPPVLQIPWAVDDELPEGVRPETEWESWLRLLESREGSGFNINGLSRDTAFSFFGERSAMAYRPSVRRVQERDARGQEAEYWQYDFPRAFRATRAGKYAFGPVSVEGVFATRADGDDLTGKQIYALAPALEVTVKDVPEEGRPADFCGAVGRFALSAELLPRQAKVGDPMTLVLELSGEGTMDKVAPPDVGRMPQVAGKFRVYEATEQTKGNARRFTYSLRPLQPGIERFPGVKLSYFDVEAERYATVESEPIPITVTKAEQLRGEQIVEGGSVKAAGRKDVESRREGIFANVTDLGAVRDESVRPGRWLAFLVVLAGIYAALATAAVRWQRLSADPALVRRRNAARRARGRIGEANELLSAGRQREALDRSEAALAGLVADTAGVPEAGLTPKDVRRELAALGVADELVERAGSFLESCDAARYGDSDRSAAGFRRQAEKLAEELIAALKGSLRLK